MKTEKTSVRLSSQQLSALDEICKKNGGCSRGQVIREAIDLLTKDVSNKDFDTNEPKKETNLEHKPITEKVKEEPVSTNIISIDGIPREKFLSGEYKIEIDSNGKF